MGIFGLFLAHLVAANQIYDKVCFGGMKIILILLCCCFFVARVHGKKDGFELECKSVAKCIYSTKQECDKMWPLDNSGTVYMYKSKEVFNGKTYSRFFHVFVPKEVKEQSAPLVIYLHGGYVNGLIAMGNFRLDKYSTGQQETWGKNTASCKYFYESRKSNGYKDLHGNLCEPTQMKTDAPTGFVIVYPSGLVDSGGDTSLYPSPLATELLSGRGYHWEDGRSPSPGWGIDRKKNNNPNDPLQYRDDVGFINHIIETLINEKSTSMPKIEKVIVGGTSNGGLMTQRVGCHVGDPKYPGLGMITALMVNVAAGMSNNVYKGLLGRARCNPQKSMRVIYTSGAGTPTPDCKQYGCKSPTTDGDGIVPIGTVGKLHNLYSPALGALASHNESMHTFLSANIKLLQKKTKFNWPEKSVEKLGSFATITKFNFKNMEFANVASFVTNPGFHMNNGFGGDFNIFETMLKFALDFDVVDSTNLKSSLKRILKSECCSPAKECPPPPTNWALVGGILGVFGTCLVCCGCCFYFGRRYIILEDIYARERNMGKRHIELDSKSDAPLDQYIPPHLNHDQ